MSLRGIVYGSQANECFDDNTLLELKNQAANRNRELSITGYLAYSNGHFVQYFEGEASVAIGLMERIRNDARHTILGESYDDQLIRRRFPNWNMRLIPGNFMLVENLLIDHFRWVADLNSQYGEDIPWRMVDQLAILRPKLEKTFG